MKSVSLAGAVLLLFLAATQEQGPLVAMHLNNCSFSYIKDVIVTDCHGLGLVDVPADIPAVTMVLNLSGNHLTHLAEQFLLSDCEASDQQSCSRFPAVSYLDLSFNQLLNLSSGCFSGMKDLRALYLGNNLLTTIPHDLFFDNRLLLIIDVSWNRFASLPAQVFQNLAQAESIDLRGNMLRTLHEDAFTGLHSLHMLSIQNNSLDALNPHVFRDLGNLQQLEISGNRLKSLPAELLRHLTNLTHFYASHNQLTSLSPEIFTDNSQLQHVDLSHNVIRKLSRYVFMVLTKARHANVAFNCLESVYLSRIPISLQYYQNITVINTAIKLCTGIIRGMPCFFFGEWYITQRQTSLAHSINYSFNNIREIIFSKTKPTHTMEFAVLSFAGNRHLSLPILFIKQERYLTSLDLSGTDMSWRNFTLFNEIFELQFIKTVRIVGCEACNYYDMQLSTIFNPDIRVIVVCSSERAWDASLQVRKFASLTRNSSSRADCISGHQGGNIPGISDSSSRSLCEYTDKQTLWSQSLNPGFLEVYCFNMMDCSFSSLSRIPEMKMSVSCLLLSHNIIEDIDHCFDSLWRLRGLDLSFNNLHRLPDNVFGGLENLIVLKISHNRLTFLGSSDFRQLKNLERLVLDGNPISSYAPDTFSNLGNLKLLSVDFEKLTQFHDETLENQFSLERLSLRETTDNATSSIILTHIHFSSLERLQFFSITGFKLNLMLGNNFFQSNDLLHLMLYNSTIHYLSVELFYNCTSVNLLGLGGNQIKKLDEQVFWNVIKLDYLDLSRNEITFLHDSLFSKTQQLRVLLMYQNRICYIPPTIFDSLTALEYLNLSNNSFIFLDYNILSKLISLQTFAIENSSSATVSNLCLKHPYLHTYAQLTHQQQQNVASTSRQVHAISRGTLTHIKKDTFHHNSQLDTLNLSENLIDKIDDEAFAHNLNLQYLSLNHNCLTRITKLMFKNLGLLKSLHLRKNLISFIDDKAFQDLLSLAVLDLGFNRLVSFNSRVLPSANVLILLILNDNSITARNLTLDLQMMDALILNNNPLTDLGTTSFRLPSLHILELQNTSLSTINSESFKDQTMLVSLNLGDNLITGLSTTHFLNKNEFTLLNVTRPTTTGASEHAGISWRNMTLINRWFEMLSLQILMFVGNPICEQEQWTQVIKHVFLSESWKIVVCSHESEFPKYYVTNDGTVLIFTNPVH